MGDERYNVVFSGGLADGYSELDVKDSLAKLLKIDNQKADKLFSATSVTVKKDTDLGTATKIVSAFARVGAVVDIKPISNGAAVDSTKPSKTKVYDFNAQRHAPIAKPDPLPTTDQGSTASSASASSVRHKSKPEADYGLFLLVIPVVATLLVWYWVSGMALIQFPGDTMMLILLGTVLGTAIVAAMEANKVGMESNKAKGTYSATAWFFIVTFIWIIGYPIYLFKRRHYGLKNYLLPGIAITIIFTVSWFAMAVAIEDKKAEVRGHFEQMQRGLESLKQ